MTLHHLLVVLMPEGCPDCSFQLPFPGLLANICSSQGEELFTVLRGSIGAMLTSTRVPDLYQLRC